MTLDDGVVDLKWLGKMPSGISLVGLISIAVVAVWSGAKLQDQVTGNAEAVKIMQVRIDGVERTLDVDSRRVDALSFRQSAGDDRTTALTSSIGMLSTDLRAYKDQQETFNRQLAISLAEIKGALIPKEGGH